MSFSPTLCAAFLDIVAKKPFLHGASSTSTNTPNISRIDFKLYAHISQIKAITCRVTYHSSSDQSVHKFILFPSLCHTLLVKGKLKAKLYANTSFPDGR